MTLREWVCVLLALSLPAVTLCSTGAEELQNVLAVEGQDCTLPCSEVSPAEVSVLEWSNLKKRLLVVRAGRVQDGYEHEDYTNRVQLKDPKLKEADSSVVLKRVTLEDSGTYQCLAEFGKDEVIIKSVHLIVRKRGAGQVVQVSEGADCVLPCTGQSHLKIQVLRWSSTDRGFHKDLLIYRAGRVQDGYEHKHYSHRGELLNPQLNTGNLGVRLKNVSLEDSGRYDCLADYEERLQPPENELKTIGNYGYVILYVTGAPLSVTAAVGEDAVLPCTGLKDGKVYELLWSRVKKKKNVLMIKKHKLEKQQQDEPYINRVELQDPRLNKGDLSLVLKEITFEDSGTYLCEVSYEAENRISQYVHLTVSEHRAREYREVSLALIFGLLSFVLFVILLIQNKDNFMKKLKFFSQTKTSSKVHSEVQSPKTETKNSLREFRWDQRRADTGPLRRRRSL